MKKGWSLTRSILFLIDLPLLISFFLLMLYLVAGGFSFEFIRSFSIHNYNDVLVIVVVLWLARLFIVNSVWKREPKDAKSERIVFPFTIEKGVWKYVAVLIFASLIINWKRLDFDFLKQEISGQFYLFGYNITDKFFVKFLLAEASVLILGIFAYKVISKFFNKGTASIFLFLLILYPFNNNFLGIFYKENLLLAFSFATIYFFSLFLEQGGVTAIIAGVILCIAIVYNPIDYAVILPILWLIFFRSRERAAKPKAIFVALLLPIAISVAWYIMFKMPISNEIAFGKISLAGLFHTGLLNDYLFFFDKLFPIWIILAVFFTGFILSFFRWGKNPMYFLIHIHFFFYLIAVALFAFAQDNIFLNYIALLLPFLFLFVSVALDFFVSDRFFNRETLDRNLAFALVVIFVCSMLVKDVYGFKYDLNKMVFARSHYRAIDLLSRREKVRDVESASGKVVFAKKNSDKGPVVFGPSHILYPGNFRATFRLRIADTAEGEDIGWVAIRSDEGKKILSIKRISTGDVFKEGSYQEFALDFFLRRASEIGFCVFSSGVVNIYVDSVTVSPLKLVGDNKR